MSSAMAERRAHGEVSFAARERRGARTTWTQSAVAWSSREVLPALGAPAAGRLFSPWVNEVRIRLRELAQLPEDWDTYGALPLQSEALERLVDILDTLAWVIQRAPAISLTSEGGLLCEWSNSRWTVDLLVEPSGSPEVTYIDALPPSRWDGPIDEAHSLDKWLWQASGMG